MVLSILILVFLYLILATIVWGLRRSDYNPILHTISELGENSKGHARAVNYTLFLVVGLVMLILALYVYLNASAPEHTLLSGIMVCTGIGYTVAALFPCDPGCPMTGGSVRQHIHNAGGFVEYIGGGYLMLTLAKLDLETEGITMLTAASYIVMVGGVIMSLKFLKPWRGLIQRGAELALFGGMIGAAYFYGL